MRRWIERPDWPFARRAPWPRKLLPKILAWAEENLGPNPAAESDFSSVAELAGSDKVRAATNVAKLRLIVEREANLRVDRLIKEREYVKREESEHNQVKKNNAIKAAFSQLGRLVRNAAANKPPDEVERIVNEAVEILLNEGFAGGGNAGTGGDDGNSHVR